MPAFPVVFPALYVGSLLADILARDTASGPNWRLLNEDQLDRRILLGELADALRELDTALDELEGADA